MLCYCKSPKPKTAWCFPYLYFGRSKHEGPQKLCCTALRMLALTGPHYCVSLRVLSPVSVFKASPSCTPKLSMPWGAREKKVQERRRTEGGAWMHPRGWGEMKITKRTEWKKRKLAKKGPEWTNWIEGSKRAVPDKSKPLCPTLFPDFSDKS